MLAEHGKGFLDARHPLSPLELKHGLVPTSIEKSVEPIRSIEGAMIGGLFEGFEIVEDLGNGAVRGDDEIEVKPGQKKLVEGKRGRSNKEPPGQGAQYVGTLLVGS